MVRSVSPVSVWWDARRLRARVAGLLVAVLLGGVYVATTAPGKAVALPCVGQRPDSLSAAATAAACGIRVEVLAARSERAQVFVNPDSTATFEASVLPKRVRRADGSWVDVDTTLRAHGDGSYAPVASPADVVISGGGSGLFVTHREGASTLTLAWPTALPVPSVSGDSALYPEVLPGVDLRVTALSTGFRHVLVVKTRAAATNPALAAVRYQVGGNVTAAPMADGRVRFVDRAGRAVLATQNASAWDSSISVGLRGEVLPGVDRNAVAAGRPADLVSNGDRPGATAISAQLRVSAGVSNTLVVTPDPGLLTAPGTVFPVFIDPQIGPTRSRWAWANDGNASYDVGGQAWVGVNPASHGGDGRRYRSFFDFPTSSGNLTYRGKQILSARFSIMLDHSWSCGDTPAYIYKTSAINVGNGGRMSWGSRPLGAGAPFLDSDGGHANEAGGCGNTQPDALMEFGGNAATRLAAQDSADRNDSTITIGICACESDGANEFVQGRWKKFHVNNDTTMSVNFNTVPGTPTNLSPHLGQVACGGVVGTRSPTLQARYVDGDGADSLTATFQYQQLPSGTVTSVAGTPRPANNDGTATVNLGASAEGKTYQFRVQTNDSHASSPWSSWCSFLVDTLAPPAPEVVAVPSGSAPVYSACVSANIYACTANGGPGVSGGFRFSSPAGGEDIVKYVFGWGSPSTSVVVSPGAAYSPVLTPPRYGINTLAVYSEDPSGKKSPTTVYTFLVNAPSQPVASWPLDSISGHDLNDQIGGANLTATGDVTWTPDARYIGANALSLDANTADGQTGQVATSGPVLDTTKSFSVAAWVRVADLSLNHVAISQDGVNRSRFMLYYSATHAKWIFAMYDQDGESSAAAYALGGTPATGKWTHLLGVYDANARQISLSINGTPAQTVAHTASWAAGGSFVVGRGRVSGSPWLPWKGDIADVRVWSRVVVPDDLLGTDADPTTGVPAQVGILSPLKVGSWRFPDGECFCDTSRDESLFARDLVLSPNWTLDPNWNADPATTPAWLSAESHDADGGLALLGSSGSASTTDDQGTLSTADDIQRPVLRTDQSMTIAAWVKLNAVTGELDIVRQGSGGVQAQAVKLHLRAADSTWAMGVTTPDGAGGYAWVTGRSDTVAQTGVWVHLVGTFDASIGVARLYLNGQLQATHYETSGVPATGWQSTGSLTIGKNFGGLIDQVHVFQGVLSAREVQNLYSTT
jgi:hypothetical protein